MQMHSDSCSFTSWPEDFPPNAELPCQECPLAHQGSRIIWGEGNPEAPVWILLDNPGMREDRLGIAFVCGTRQSIHTAAAEFGYSEDSLYVTYVVRRRPLRKYPKEEERNRCIQNLFLQMTDASPTTIFCMGDVAVSSLLGREAHVKDLRGERHFLGNRSWLATYHPLAVRRRPNLLERWREDWQLLRTLHPLHE